MEFLTRAEVLTAVAAVHDAWPLSADVDAVRTDDCVVLCGPAHVCSPTSGRVQAWVNSSRPFLEIRAEVERLALGWEADEVWWWAEGEVAPAVGEALRSAGAHLAARCRLGRAQGATLALTKARPGTSVPVLERVGFCTYGAGHCWRLHVDG